MKKIKGWLKPPAKSKGTGLNSKSRFSKNQLIVFLVLFVIIGGLAIIRSFAATPTYKQVDFSSDPQWVGVNNRSPSPCATLGPYKFGYKNSNKVNGSGPGGEIGGTVPDYGQHVAYYAKKLSNPRNLTNKLYASGSLILPDPNNDSTVLFGWFNHDSTDWRTNNFIGVRITDGYSNDGGNNTAFAEMATKSGLAGGLQLKISDSNVGILVAQTKATWTLTYDPSVGPNGTLSLSMTTSLGTFQAAADLSAQQRQDGATFDHFGIYNSQRGGKEPNGNSDKGSTKYKNILLDDITLNTGTSDANQTFNFATDPGWEGQNNEPVDPVQDCWVHNREDFGYSATTNMAGGQTGELGGIIWNGVSEKQSYYADTTSPLNFTNNILYATGRIVMNHAHPDTDIPYIGWFNHNTSHWANSNAAQGLDEQNFVGARLGGTSRQGHNLQPGFFNNAKDGTISTAANSVEPKTIARQFYICYIPNIDAAGNGQITAGMLAVPSAGIPDKAVKLSVSASKKTTDTTFDSFGFISPNIGGAGFIQFFVDDLRYTVAPGDSAPADRCGTPYGTPPPADTTSPTVSLTAPASGANVSGSSVNITADAADNIGVAGVQFKLDGNNIGSEDTSAPYSLSWNSSSTTNGSHSLTAVARDATGNTKTSTAIPITVSNQAPPTPTTPVVSFVSPTAGSYVRGSALNIVAKVTDQTPIANVQFKLDGANLGSADSTDPFSAIWNSTQSADGNHIISATATNTAGGSNTGYLVLRVDNSAPTAFINSPAYGSRVRSKVLIKASIYENIRITRASLRDGGKSIALRKTAPFGRFYWDSRKVKNGRHYLQLLVYDVAGNHSFSNTIKVYVKN